MPKFLILPILYFTNQFVYFISELINQKINNNKYFINQKKIRQMGKNHSRIIEVTDIQQKLTQCIQIQTKNCPIYGTIYFVQYQNMQFYITESQTCSPPAINSIHWLTQSNLLIIPKFTLLQQTQIQSIQQLMQLMIGVVELCRQDEVGVGYNRIGYAKNWGVVGQKTSDWAYRQIFKERDSKGIYLAPELMLGLSQLKMYPKYDKQKSDVFALGIMLLEIIFKESMQNAFDYNEFEIKLKPLLEKLNFIKQNYGQKMYTIFLKMLELDPDQRISFDQLLQMIQNYKKTNAKLLSSNMTSSTNSNFQQSSRRAYKNQVSPLRTFGNREKTPGRLGTTPERSRIISTNRENRSPIRQSDYQKQQYQRLNKSPLRRDLRINTKFDKENNQSNFTNMGFNSTKAINKPNIGRMQGFSPLMKR